MSNNLLHLGVYYILMLGSVKANRREIESFLVKFSTLSYAVLQYRTVNGMHMATSTVENSAQVLSC
jgi:hypothetical protein